MIVRNNGDDELSWDFLLSAFSASASASTSASASASTSLWLDIPYPLIALLHFLNHPSNFGAIWAGSLMLVDLLPGYEM